MPRQMLAVGAILSVAAACSGGAAENSTTAPSSTVATVTTATTTTSTTSTTVALVSAPRLASLDLFPIPIGVIEEAVLSVDGACVTAQTDDKTLLLIFDLLGANVVGEEVWIEDWDPETPTVRVLSSGARYQLRGVPEPFEAELREPLPPGCEYDERLIVVGALDVPVGRGLTTYPLAFKVAIAAETPASPIITIDGACTTITFTDYDPRDFLVIWPAATVSLLDDHTIHMSRWEWVTEIVIRSGNAVVATGTRSDRVPDDPVPDCEYDGTFEVEIIWLASE